MGINQETIDKFCTSFFLCNSCLHKNVCKFKENDPTNCENFSNSCNYKIYGNIYDMFQPIFNWLQYHYPTNEVRFVVDRYSAQLMQEHKLYVADKNLDKHFKEAMCCKSDENQSIKKNQE